MAGKKSTWRQSARPIIAKVLADNEGKPEGVIKKALRAAYPFGERALHPYKVWCDEIKVQRGKRTFGVRPDKLNPDQQKLF
jgi:hypothetical protein